VKPKLSTADHWREEHDHHLPLASAKELKEERLSEESLPQQAKECEHELWREKRKRKDHHHPHHSFAHESSRQDRDSESVLHLLRPQLQSVFGSVLSKEKENEKDHHPHRQLWKEFTLELLKGESPHLPLHLPHHQPHHQRLSGHPPFIERLSLITVILIMALNLLLPQAHPHLLVAPVPHNHQKQRRPRLTSIRLATTQRLTSQEQKPQPANANPSNPLLCEKNITMIPLSTNKSVINYVFGIPVWKSAEDEV